MLISIGVDVGSKNGALAIIDSNLNILKLAKAPFYQVEIKSKVLKPKLNKATGMYEKDYRKQSWSDFKTLRDIYSPYIKNNIIYTVEHVSARPKEGETSAFIFGDSLGVHQGQYSYLNPVDYYEPTPQVWKKELGVTSDKDTSIELVESIFNCNLRDYLKRGKTDDIAEALLLSFYGLKKYLEKNGDI